MVAACAEECIRTSALAHGYKGTAPVNRRERQNWKPGKFKRAGLRRWRNTQTPEAIKPAASSWKQTFTLKVPQRVQVRNSRVDLLLAAIRVEAGVKGRPE
jgi:hypothetical protein